MFFVQVEASLILVNSRTFLCDLYCVYKEQFCCASSLLSVEYSDYRAVRKSYAANIIIMLA